VAQRGDSTVETPLLHKQKTSYTRRRITSKTGWDKTAAIS